MNELQIREQMQPLLVRVDGLARESAKLVAGSPESQQAAIKLHGLLKIDMAQESEGLIVDSPESQQAVIKLCNLLKIEQDIVDAQEKEFTKPLNDTLRKLRDVFRPVKDTISNALTIAENAASDYQVKMKQLEADLQAKEDKLASRRKSPLPVPVSRHIEIAQKKVEGTNWIDHWECEITNFEILANEYKLPNISALNKVANESKGKVEITGAKILYKPYQRRG